MRHRCGRRLAAIPLFWMTAQRVTNGCDLMDAAYCSSVVREHSHSLGHAKVMSHLMFGMLALTADQILRLST